MTVQTVERDVSAMSLNQLLALPHLTEEEMRLVQKRLETAEAEVDLEEQQVEKALLETDREKRDIIQNHKKLIELETLYKQRLANFATLERMQATFGEQKREYATKQRQCSQRQSALKGVERDMAQLEKNKMLSIVNRSCEEMPLKVLAKEDDKDLFLSVTSDERLVVEEFFPRELLFPN